VKGRSGSYMQKLPIKGLPSEIKKKSLILNGRGGGKGQGRGGGDTRKKKGGKVLPSTPRINDRRNQEMRGGGKA